MNSKLLEELKTELQKYHVWINYIKKDMNRIRIDPEKSKDIDCLPEIGQRIITGNINHLLLHIDTQFVQGGLCEIIRVLDEFHLTKTTVDQRNCSILWMKENEKKAMMTYNDMKQLVAVTSRLWSKKKRDMLFKHKKTNYIETIKLVQRWSSGSNIRQETINTAILKSMVLALGSNTFSKISCFC